MRSGIAATVILAVVLGGVAACGGSGSKTTSSSTSSVVAPTTSPTAPGTSTSTTRKKTAIKVKYPSGGPADRMFPSNDDAFAVLTARNCSGLRTKADQWQANGDIRGTQKSAIALYRGAAEACLGQWTQAKADLAQVSQSDVNSCDRQIVLAFLRDMVAAHDSQPDLEPDTSGTGSSCPDPSATTTTKSTTATSSTTTTVKR